MSSLTDTFLRHYRDLLGFLSSRTGSREVAQDCAHDTWLKVHDLADRVSPDNPRAYLYRTAANVAMDWHRANAREAQGQELYASMQLPAHETDTLDVVSARQSVIKLEKTLRKQSHRSLQIFLLHRHDDLNYREIATRLDISVSTVEKHMMRMLLACEEALR